MPKPLVFISSVIEGFRNFREAARQAVESCEARAIMAEDFPASATSPRNACLDGVGSSDVYLVIVGDRGGWKTPSGKLATAEEYEEARRLHKPICAFIQKGEKDADAERFAATVSNYVSGHLRRSFGTSTDLESEIRKSLPQILSTLKLPMMAKSEIEQRLQDPYSIQHEATVRLVIAPERSEEVIDRVRIAESDFIHKILAIAHAVDVEFFSYKASKGEGVKKDTLTIQQAPSARGAYADVNRRVEMTTAGIISLDAIVSTRGDSFGDMSYMFQLSAAEVERALTSMFAFVSGVFELLDPHRRHERFLYGAAVTNIGFRSLVSEMKPQSGGSMARNLEGPLPIEAGRLIDRDSLSAPASEVKRIINLLKRAIDDAS